ATAERIYMGPTKEVAQSIRVVHGGAKGAPKAGIRLGQPVDEPLPCSLIGRLGNGEILPGEELLFLKLDSLPGGVPEDNVETSSPSGCYPRSPVVDVQDLREPKMPMKEAMSVSEVFDFVT